MMGVGKPTFARIMAATVTRIVTQRDIDILSRPVLWVQNPFPDLQVGDPFPVQRSVLSKVRRRFAALDDFVLRPLVHASPYLLGAGVGLAFGSLRLFVGAAAVAYTLPSDWYISQFSQGLLGGMAAGRLWHASKTVMGAVSLGSIAASRPWYTWAPGIGPTLDLLFADQSYVTEAVDVLLGQ